MGKRRRIRQRDSEATRRKLLDAVSAIMRDQGFSGLRTGAIARIVGRDKNLIRYHFSGLAGLQKAYIREKDYWPPFFERFAISQGSSAFDLERLFSELMAENLRFFYGDVEMQKIILWQISERNALMRSISDAREAEGEKLLGLTDKFFSGTDVNFRAVIALLLGGAYYMVLHANGNGSVVCGIDVHSQRDRDDVLRAIAQVVSWTFRQVGNGPVGGSLGEVAGGESGGVFSVLDKLASRFGRFVFEGRKDDGYLNLLEVEVQRIHQWLEQRLIGISDPVQLSSVVRVCMFRLGDISDRFYVELEDNHHEAALAASLLDIFLEGFSGQVPGELVLPKVIWEREFLGLSTSVGQLERVLEVLKIDVLLARALKEPFLHFFAGKGVMSYGDLVSCKKYLVALTEQLGALDVSDGELFLCAVVLGENGTGLLDYLKQRIGKSGSGVSALERKMVLLTEIKRIELVLVQGNGTAKTMLLGWLERELLEVSQSGLMDVNRLKFTSELKIVELSYLLKLLFDQGVFGQVKLDVFVQQVGHNFMSSSGSVVSPGSVKSKLYPKDKEVISVVEDILVSMLQALRMGK